MKIHHTFQSGGPTFVVCLVSVVLVLGTGTEASVRSASYDDVRRAFLSAPPGAPSSNTIHTEETWSKRLNSISPLAKSSPAEVKVDSVLKPAERQESEMGMTYVDSSKFRIHTAAAPSGNSVSSAEDVASNDDVDRVGADEETLSVVTVESSVVSRHGLVASPPVWRHAILSDALSDALLPSNEEYDRSERRYTHSALYGYQPF